MRGMTSSSTVPCAASIHLLISSISILVASVSSVLHKLFAEKEKPELILGTMIMAFVDMYRAKVAVSSGEKANFAASCYNYRGREFRLRNASYDSRNISIKTLRKNLDSLNEADRKLKIRVTDEKIILEKLLVELLRSEQ